MMIGLDSSRGYCRTARASIDRHPTARMIRLITIARTGFLMKISVNDRTCVSRAHRRCHSRDRTLIHQLAGQLPDSAACGLSVAPPALPVGADAAAAGGPSMILAP